MLRQSKHDPRTELFMNLQAEFRANGLTHPIIQKQFASVALGRKIEVGDKLSYEDLHKCLCYFNGTEEAGFVALLLRTHHAKKWKPDYMTLVIKEVTGKQRISELTAIDLVMILQHVGVIPSEETA
ncbi:hypothetical protein [Tumebacillus permanentifrigoris]|uniref:Uncharacterized protein n=1 Tax=Tumebacillus permanentifrigoris TaxID=378543 RepID=A0A316D4C5_9BACL|nr:hypothetical protein [Tumebacillus permanentifrigoris]PWK05077.1 hypothetical protein C7459_1279 [Tumebacillus permanentifrigoris]